jgi:hypothetical protein
LAAVLAIALVVVLVTRDDDSASTATDSTTSTSSSVASTTVTPGTTSSRATTATTPTTASLPPLTNDTQSYAKYLFAAWQNNNQQAAAQVASQDAINQMFAQAYSPQTPYTLGPCAPAAGSVYCTWTAPSGAQITMTVRNITGGLPIQVVNVSRA